MFWFTTPITLSVLDGADGSCNPKHLEGARLVETVLTTQHLSEHRLLVHDTKLPIAKVQHYVASEVTWKAHWDAWKEFICTLLAMNAPGLKETACAVTSGPSCHCFSWKCNSALEGILLAGRANEETMDLVFQSFPTELPQRGPDLWQELSKKVQKNQTNYEMRWGREEHNPH